MSAFVSSTPALREIWSAYAEICFAAFHSLISCWVLFLGASVGNREQLPAEARVLPRENIRGFAGTLMQGCQNSWDAKKHVQLEPFPFG